MRALEQIQEQALHANFTDVQQQHFGKLMSELEKISGGLGFAELKEKAEAGNKEALQVMRDYIDKKEQIVVFIETKQFPSKEIAVNLIVDYFSKRQQEVEDSMKDPNTKITGGDFDIARCEAYLQRAREEKFHEEFNLSGMYDGKPMTLSEPSIFDFFEKIADATKEYIKAFKDDLALVEKRKKLGEKAQKIVDAILETEKK